MNEFDKENYDLWKWGIFYYNPKDPNLTVEKRNGLGYTFNFGHKISFVILGLILVFIVGEILYSTGVIKF
jgi:uncharacterized membrane protein